MTAHFARLAPDPCTRRRTARDLAADVRADALAAAVGERPYVVVNMVASVDGRAAVDGRAGPLANAADKALFVELRAHADAVLVGAETVRAERYGRILKDPALRARRVEMGLEPDPLAVIASRSLRLDPTVGLLADPDSRVVIVTPVQSGEIPPCAARVSYVREPHLARALARLRAELGVEMLLCEGGPALNGSLLAADALDELHLVVAARLAGGTDALTILTGPPLRPPRPLRLRSVHEAEGYLFLRYPLEPAG